MIGFSALLPKLFFVLIASGFAVGLHEDWRPVLRRQSPVTGRLLLVSALALLWAGVMSQLFVRELYLHHKLSQLHADSVESIEVGSHTITDRNDISAIVNALNGAQWFTSNHGGWADEVPLVINLRTEGRQTYHVGFYLRQKGAVLVSMSSFDPKGARWSNGYAFYERLPEVLARIGVVLPDCQSIQKERPCAK